MKYFAGIGSRSTPPEILSLMTDLSQKLTEMGYILRSGGAKGADSAFEKGVVGPNKEIFKSRLTPWALEEVKKYIPTDRANFDSWTPYIQGLMARNMMQILGRNGDEPVDFVICWTPSLIYTDSSSGGTGWAIRCALAHKIKIYNLLEDKNLQIARNFLIRKP